MLKTCQLCGGVLPMCRCEIEGITARAKAIVNHERWRKAPVTAKIEQYCDITPPRILPADEEPKPIFVGIRKTVMQGEKCVGVMCSKTMAKRTANALNRHKPNREGV